MRHAYLFVIYYKFFSGPLLRADRLEKNLKLLHVKKTRLKQVLTYLLACVRVKLTKSNIVCVGKSILGVKVRNMKMDFNTGGTWRRVSGNEH